MNISVDYYEELYLKNKDKETVKAEVENIRRQIARIKYEMEAPAFSYEDSRYPSRVADILDYSGYLERALSMLSEMSGGLSLLTEEEKASAVFDSECADISNITLTLGKYFEKKYILDLNESSALLTVLQRDSEPQITELDREDVISSVYDLHIGAWRDMYTPEQYSCTLDEPVKWHLCVEYKSGAAPRIFEGLGIFPYNFDGLCKILGADKD